MLLHHLAMRTGNLPKLLHFYSDLLELPVIKRSERSAWLDAGGVILMLEARGENESPIPAGSMEMIAFAIEPEAQQGWRERLEKAGLPIEAETPFTLYFRDPDGRRLGVSHYGRATTITPTPGKANK